MRSFLRHPVTLGVLFEAVLVTWFILYPVGACNHPPISIALVFLHIPAMWTATAILGLPETMGTAALAAVLTAGQWIALLYLLRYLRRLGRARRGAPPEA